MGKGGSSSSSTTEQTTQNFDQRVASEGGGLALGSGAAIVAPTSTYNTNEFSDNVAKAYQSLVDFAAGSLSTVKEAQAKSIALGERAVDAAVETGQGALDYVNKSNVDALNAIVTIGQGAADYVNKSNVEALNAIVTIGQGAADIVKFALESVKTQGEVALTKVTENQQAQNPASTSIYKDLFPWVAIAAVALIAIFVFGKGH